MRETIDQLIYERANWMRGHRIQYRFARYFMRKMLGYEATVAKGEELLPMTGAEAMDNLAAEIARHVDADALDAIPDKGAAMIVSNHPTGIADGIMMWAVLRHHRPDLFFFANGDAVRVLPQLEELIAPVEWRKDKRSHSHNRRTLIYAKKAFEEDRLAVLFPSGRLAKRRGLALHERDWMQSAGMMAKKWELPVIPMHITARNSALFYLFDAIHPSFRDVTLFHETMNKTDHPYRIRVGRPFDGGALPANSVEATETMKRAVLSLPGQDRPTLISPRLSPSSFVRKLVTSTSA